MTKAAVGIAITVMAFCALLGVVVLEARKSPTSPVNNPAAVDTATGMGESQNQALQPTQTVVDNAVAIAIQDYAYGPQKITVKVGTTVTWTNRDSVKHDVMPDQAMNGFTGGDLLGRGQSYSFTFTQPGTYSYFCSPHTYMKGVVEVVE